MVIGKQRAAPVDLRQHHAIHRQRNSYAAMDCVANHSVVHSCG